MKSAHSSTKRLTDSHSYFDCIWTSHLFVYNYLMLKVIFEDEYLMVIDKPPGLVVDLSETQRAGTLEDILRDEYHITAHRSGIVHRLDKDTSGLLVVAKSEQLLEKLQEQFKNRSVKKEYIALVHGEVKGGGTVLGTVGRNPSKTHKFMVKDDGKEAETEYQPIDHLKMSVEGYNKAFGELSKAEKHKMKQLNYDQLTLVRCFPKTGRTHQIRVHMQHIHHPIVGDKTYAGRNYLKFDPLWANRQFLHAAKLSFIHPVTNEPLEFEVDLPDDLKNICNLLSPYSSN